MATGADSNAQRQRSAAPRLPRNVLAAALGFDAGDLTAQSLPATMEQVVMTGSHLAQIDRATSLLPARLLDTTARHGVSSVHSGSQEGTTMTKTTSVRYLLAAACVASTLGCGGGSNTPSYSPVAAAPPAAPIPAPVPFPLPPPAPVSNAPYFLAGASGPYLPGRTNYAGGTLTMSSAALTLVDPANPTAPVQLEPGGTWSLLGRVRDGTPANGSVNDVYERYVVYTKAGRIWRVDLAKSSVQTPVALSSQTLDGICEGSVEIFQSLPGHTSTVLYRSPGSDGACHTAELVTRAVRLDASPSISPTVVDGEVLAPIYSAMGAIDGWILRKGSQLLRQSASFDPVSTKVLATFDGSADTGVQAVGVAGAAFPGSLLVATRPPADAPVRLQVINLDSGATWSLGDLPPGSVAGIGTDSSHYYFKFEPSDFSYTQIRRFDHVSPPPVTELVVQEPASGTMFMSTAMLTRDRVVYAISDWDSYRLLKSVPKSAANVRADDPLTAPQPTPLFSHGDLGEAFLYDWDASGAAVWQKIGFPSTTRLQRDDGTSMLASLSGHKVGELVATSLLPGASRIAGLLMAEQPDASFRLYTANEGSLLASYGTLPFLPLAPNVGYYYHFAATLMRPDAPALISALHRQGGTDLYFINGTSAGLTRVTNNVAVSVPTSSAATAGADTTSRVSQSEPPDAVRGLWNGLVGRAQRRH